MVCLDYRDLFVPLPSVTTGSGHFVTVTKYPDPDVTYSDLHRGREPHR